MSLPPTAARYAAKILGATLYLHMLDDAAKDREADIARDLIRERLNAAEMEPTLLALAGGTFAGGVKTAASKEAFGRALGAAFKALKGSAPKGLKRRDTLKRVGGAALGAGASYGASRGLSSAGRRMARPVPLGRAWGARQLAPKKRLTPFGYSGS